MENGWELLIFYNFGRTDQDQIDDGLVNVERALIALDVELAADGSVQCRSAVARADCSASYNPFGAGTITSEAINYLKAPGTF
jgi:iron complex outermembrane receptor protein